MKYEPQKEHEWLQRLVGDWRIEGDDHTNPGKKLEGRETFQSLNGMWFVGQGQGEMPGGSIGHTLMTLGYDPDKNCYVGTWVGSMMTYLWVYRDGQLDESGNMLTLTSTGQVFTEDGTPTEGTTDYRDVIEFVDDNHRILRGMYQKDGKWEQMMETHYYRV